MVDVSRKVTKEDHCKLEHSGRHIGPRPKRGRQTKTRWIRWRDN